MANLQKQNIEIPEINQNSIDFSKIFPTDLSNDAPFLLIGYGTQKNDKLIEANLKKQTKEHKNEFFTRKQRYGK